MRCVQSCLVLASVLLAACTSASSTADVWIAPSGSDTSGTGSQASPWASPQRALEYVAHQRSNGGGILPGPVVINVEPGTYLSSTPIDITAQTAGSPEAGVTIAAVNPLVPAVFSGGAALTPSGNGPNGTVMFQIPQSVACDGRCRQLFRIAGPSALLGRRSLSKSPTMEYAKISTSAITVGSGQLANYSPASLAAGEAVFFQSWTSSIGMLKTNTGWDPATGTLSFQRPINAKCYNACLNRYFVQNLLDPALMAPGSFSLDDRDPTNRTIMYKPYPDEDIAAGDFAVANISQVLTTSAAEGQPKPSNVTVRGITFSHSASALGSCISAGCGGQSASSGNSAAVRLQNATHITLINCTVTGTGHYGVWVDVGSSDIVVSHSNLHDLGAGGIRIGQPLHGVASDTQQQVQRVTVSDNTISNTGLIVMAGAGVLSQQANDISITHNDIGNTLYTGVSTGWTWGYAPTSVSNVSVTFNDIHDIFQGELSDGGCVYTLGIQPGGLVHNNRCWNVHSAGYGGWGTYTDEGSSFITFSNNLIYNTKSAGHHQHYGENNTIENNIIAFPGKWPCDGVPGCDNAGLRSSQHAPGSGGGGPFSSFSFLRNIMLLDQLYSPPMYTTIPTGLKNDTLDSNVYWSLTNQSDLYFGPSQDPMSFANWQQTGKDVHSVVADPQFVDPQALNFDLQPTSPALKLGFKPIDFSTNGPRPMPAF